ncbi:MAG: carboxypeptidase-like regulatory domain-containing protein [Cyclobacteriaceae bacterium]
MARKQFPLLLLLLISFASHAQNILNIKMGANPVDASTTLILRDIEEQHGIRFFYLDSWFENSRVEIDFNGLTLQEALTEITRGTDLSFTVLDNYAIIFSKDPTQALQRREILTDAARGRKKIDNTMIGDPANPKPGNEVVLTGRIIDGKTKEAIAGVSVYVNDMEKGTITDPDGNYRMAMSKGEHIITYSYINYEEKLTDLRIYNDGKVDVNLEEVPRLLDEVVISDRANREIVTSSVGQTQISIKELKRAPALLGEVDLIKQIQNLPGVTTTGEASSGFNVRGGGVDQNLILYDGLPVFNSSHAFGFFSAFNSEAIRDVTFYRGGIPAEYGGGVSSALVIRSKEGDYTKWGGAGGIGLLSSNLQVNGPIKKDKTSVIASLRSTYSDWLINTVRTNYVDLRNSTVRFYDGAFKVAHRFNDNTKLTFSGYASRDQFRLQGDTTYSWQNRLAAVRLDHSFSPRISSSIMAGYGSYGYDVEDRDPQTGFNLSYQITYPTVKADFNFQMNPHKINFGVQSHYYQFDPGRLDPISAESNVRPVKIQDQTSLETSFYVGDQFTISERVYLEAGVRFSTFRSMGPRDVYIYAPNAPLETLNITDTVSYKSGETIDSQFGLEPRASFRYTINDQTSIKAGYNRIYQYLHLVTNTAAVTPIDIWQPSGTYFKPQFADQLSIGYFKTLKEKTYEFFIEGYYKQIQNVLDFKDGAQLILNEQIETDLLQGKGRAYGVETQISKQLGRLTGSLAYTYSRSLRTISGPTTQETINNGVEYASNYDQPHIINLNWKYAISKRYFFTGNFTYRQGRPVTLPVSAFVIDNIPVSNFSERNQFRIPDYHRLDIALVVEGNHRRKKFWDGTWTFSFYNLYARKNAYSVFFKEVEIPFVNQTVSRPYQLAIIGTVLPSITYSFKF